MRHEIKEVAVSVTLILAVLIATFTTKDPRCLWALFILVFTY